MQSSSTPKSVRKVVFMPPVLAEMVEAKANLFGMKLSDYIKVLLVNDVRSNAELRTVEVSDEFARDIKQGISDYEHNSFDVVEAKNLTSYLKSLAKNGL